MGKSGYILLSIYCILLFGYSMIGGRPLTMHEARLPQTTREMTASDNWEDWIVPKSGGRPWVERPPLPHWITAAITAPLGGQDEVWKVRLPSALAGLLCTLLLAFMATRLFGRQTGILAGFIQATTYELFSYSWLAEDDIFLTLIIYCALAIFIKLEFPKQDTAECSEGKSAKSESINPFGLRPLPVLLLFVLLGLTNMVKGLVFGTVMALIPIAGLLLWNFNWRRIMRYIWIPGWIVFAVVSLWWPFLAEQITPGSYDIWHYDLFGRLNKGYLAQPIYYYLQNLPGIIAPWTPFGVLGVIITAKALIKKKELRFVWCWAILTIIIFSIPQSKHHHYLLHITGAWAILSAFGLRWFWEKLAALPKILTNPLIGLLIAAGGLAPLWLIHDKGRFNFDVDWLIALSVFILCAVFVLFVSLRTRRSSLALTAFLLGFAGLAAFMHSYIAPVTDQTIEDTKFLQAVSGKVPEDAPLLVNAQGSMDFFREMFYLPSKAKLLHNETYLMQKQYVNKTIYLIDRSSQQKRLGAFGKVELISQSVKSRREKEHGGKLTLYKIKISATLKTYKFIPVNPMQAMSREEGPYLGQTPNNKTDIKK